MEKNKYDLQYSKGTDYKLEYENIFRIPQTEEEIQTINLDADSALRDYGEYFDLTLIKLLEFIQEEQITSQTMKANSNELLFLKNLVSTLGLKKTEKAMDTFQAIGLKKTISFIVDAEAILAELKVLNETLGLPAMFNKPVLALISVMVNLKIRMGIEEDYGQVLKGKKGSIPQTKALLNKKDRQLRENKPKSKFEDEIEAQMHSDEGREQIKMGMELLSKNKSGGYNMNPTICTIFEMMVPIMEAVGLSKNQQYKTVYPLFREIYPERKMYLNEEDYYDSDKEHYIDFADYQIGTVKTILGVTR